MTYFKIGEVEYCLSWRYYTGNQVGSVEMLKADECITALQKEIFNFYKNCREDLYWMEKSPETMVLFTECLLSTVVTSTDAQGNKLREYTTVESGIARRSPGDAHVKKIAREISARKLLKSKTIDKQLKKEIAHIMFKN